MEARVLKDMIFFLEFWVYWRGGDEVKKGNYRPLPSKIGKF